MKPVLNTNPLIGIDLFSGGGGIKAGWLDAGILPAVGIELDPNCPQLSYQMSAVQRYNFAGYGSKVINQTVQQMAAQNFPGVPRSPFILHMSPVCASFSKANIGGFEKLTDIEAGQACAAAIKELSADYITLENVGNKNYLESRQFKIICDALQEQNYQYYWRVIDMADYGIPQNRIRAFLLANKPNKKPMKFPPKQPQKGWGWTISDLDLEPVPLLPKQQEAIASYLQHNNLEMLLIERSEARKNKGLKLREAFEPAWTITKSAWRDEKGAGRSKAFCVWIKDKGSFALPLRAAARICGFPDWYALPGEPALAGAIIGYAVPPAFISLLIKSNFSSEVLNGESNYFMATVG